MSGEVLFFFGASAFLVLLSIYFGIFVFPYRDYTEETKRRPRSFISNAFFREFWYFIMEPLKRKLIEWDVAPNTITLWGCVFSLAAGYAFAWNDFGLGAWAVILSATCDIYDGQLARARNISLKSGAFLDSILDRVGEAAIFSGLLWHYRFSPAWFCIIFLGAAASQLVSYSRARAEGLGFPGSRGFFQRAERMIVLSIGMGIVPLIAQFASLTAADTMVNVTVAIVCLGSVQTALSRSFGIYYEIRSGEPAFPKKTGPRSSVKQPLPTVHASTDEVAHNHSSSS